MRARFTTLAGVTALAGALVLGLAVAPASATVSDGNAPLVETIADLDNPASLVVSGDATTLYVLGEGADSSATVNLATREVTGRSAPVISYMRNDIPRPTVATGNKFAVAGWDSYAIVELGTDHVEYFEDVNGTWPELSYLVANENGEVRAISDEGEFLTFNGTDFLVRASSRGAGDQSTGNRGVSPDGMLYFESYIPAAAPEQTITAIVSMYDGSVKQTISGTEDNPYEPIAFDASGDSTWGRYLNDPDTLVNSNWYTYKKDFPDAIVPDAFPGEAFIDGARDWFVAGHSPLAGGTLSDAELRGARAGGFRVMNSYLLPGEGGLVFFDNEIRRVNIANTPTIEAPESLSRVKVGDSVSFTATAEGLAMTDPTEFDPFGRGFNPDRLFGSVWQSSPDGTTWTDIAGADGATLTLTASVENAQLEYRRHFFDAFWGEQNSASARMNVVQGPTITRADDLPNGIAGQDYEPELITATGESDLSWSSTDLPAGLVINAESGWITGVATKAGSYEFTVTVTDEDGQTDSKLFHLKVTESSVVPPIKPPVTPPTTTPLPNTGTDGWGSAAGLAAALLALGAAGLLASRRRAAALKR